MTEQKKKRNWRLTLWIPVVLAFVLVIVAWSILINIAANNPTERIPIANSEEP
ncbi:hypothetical protein [Rubellicoccus peritrichatus]|uniref:Uncharacterized protein n=1 Tax=Rubellicoccus peritrichatus TaxID=3080537 RepID=A0AAQ3QUW2_9BACT|nr:hypothetical protein [Puniceicoccus sp. CR14]WOO40217.1 hypothetical protein RZN69_16475 [Puniceicoccus sp. CR14]